MKLKTVRTLINGLAVSIIAMLIPFWLIEWTDSRVYTYVVYILWGAMFLALLVVELRFWRCPHCGRRLGRDVKQFCTHCGEKLDL